jgi:hypothetical protein
MSGLSASERNAATAKIQELQDEAIRLQLEKQKETQ